MAGIFHFKQFSIDQTNCAMKINTDGVLLGALTETKDPKTILDIGTGTGVIALMLAQRFADALINAVEVDEATAQTAIANLNNSIFADRLKLYHASFQDYFGAHTDKKYDLIVSNPPFYIKSLKSPGEGKKLAKHADASFFNDLVINSYNHLTDTGLLCLILPVDTATLVKNIASENGLYARQIIDVKSYAESTPHREILSFGKHQTKIAATEFVIYDEPKQYSGQYRTALHDFFTIF